MIHCQSPWLQTKDVGMGESLCWEESYHRSENFHQYNMLPNNNENQFFFTVGQ